jgi:hypothetical protein
MPFRRMCPPLCGNLDATLRNSFAPVPPAICSGRRTKATNMATYFPPCGARARSLIPLRAPPSPQYSPALTDTPAPARHGAVFYQRCSISVYPTFYSPCHPLVSHILAHGLRPLPSTHFPLSGQSQSAHDTQCDHSRLPGIQRRRFYKSVCPYLFYDNISLSGPFVDAKKGRFHKIGFRLQTDL